MCGWQLEQELELQKIWQREIQRVFEGFRSLAGVTDPTVAAPGTIRGDLARQQATKVVQNIVHGSDSVESAEREISIFFGGK